MPKRTAQQLKERAKELLKKAKELENERATKIGRLVILYEARDFAGFDLDTFKEQIKKF